MKISHFYKNFFFLCIYPLRIMQSLLFLHEFLSFASLSAVPHVSSSFLKSSSKVFLRVIFGLPCFLQPGGFHLKPFFGILFCSILSTCPSHLCHLCLTSVPNPLLMFYNIIYDESFFNSSLISKYICIDRCSVFIGM